MKVSKMLGMVGASAFLSALVSISAEAATVWTDWEAATLGASGSVAGSLDGVDITYNGQLLSGTIIDGSSALWNPQSSYVGGLIGSSPSEVGDILAINQSTGTITFSSIVLNPVIAFWSLGQPGVAAQFDFNATPLVQVGGPNSVYGGSSIYVVGNSVFGNEGNGVVLFEGAYNSISWTSSYENYYGITLGSVSEVPVPSAAWLFVSGVALLVSLTNRRKSRLC